MKTNIQLLTEAGFTKDQIRKAIEQRIHANNARHNARKKFKKNKLHELLDPVLGAGEYVRDFVHSPSTRFAKFGKKKRIQMGLAAYYAAKEKQPRIKRKQTASLRKLFKQPPGKRKHQGPRTKL